MECGFFFSLWRRGTHILFLGAAGREGAGLPNSSLLWKRLKADTHSPKHRKPSSAGKTVKESEAPAPQGVTQRQCSLAMEAMRSIS